MFTHPEKRPLEQPHCHSYLYYTESTNHMIHSHYFTKSHVQYINSAHIQRVQESGTFLICFYKPENRQILFWECSYENGGSFWCTVTRNITLLLKLGFVGACKKYVQYSKIIHNFNVLYNGPIITLLGGI